MYVLIVLAIIVSYVPMNFYTQVLIQAHRSACQINYQQS
jgi:hypothetical protein